MIADGAHTKGSARVLVDTIREVYPDRKLLFVVAMADDKDHRGFLEELYKADPVAVVCTQMQVAGASSRTTPAKTLAKAYVTLGQSPAPTSEDDFDTAVKRALSWGDDKIVVVTGSLYTFQALRKALL
jgi:folylpolyglutamate synthase/dihydropteroate synthase